MSGNPLALPPRNAAAAAAPAAAPAAPAAAGAGASAQPKAQSGSSGQYQPAQGSSGGGRPLALPTRGERPAGATLALPARGATAAKTGRAAPEALERARLQAELEAVRYSEPGVSFAEDPLPAPEPEPEPEPELLLVPGPEAPRTLDSSGSATFTLPARNGARRAASKPKAQLQRDDWSEHDAPDITDLSARPILPSKGEKFSSFRPEQSRAISAAVLERPGTALWKAKQQNTAGVDMEVEEPPRIVLADAVQEAVKRCHKTPEDQEFMLQLCGDAAPTQCGCTCEELDFHPDEEHPFSMRQIAIAIRQELDLAAVTKEEDIAERARAKIKKELERFDLKTLTGHDIRGPKDGEARHISETPKVLKSDLLYHLRTRAWEETFPGSGEWKYENGVASVVKCPLDEELYKKLPPGRKVTPQRQRSRQISHSPANRRPVLT
jgi:hypothetical protein